MDARAQVLAILAQRAAGSTICPSEVARILAAANGDPLEWRGEMPRVHSAIDRLVSDGEVDLSWKGQRLASRQGPYRIQTSRPGS